MLFHVYMFFIKVEEFYDIYSARETEGEDHPSISIKDEYFIIMGTHFNESGHDSPQSILCHTFTMS